MSVLAFFMHILAKSKHKEGHNKSGFPLCQLRRGVSPLYKGRGARPMSDLRAMAHLQEQLGNERFQALISSGNTGKVKAFCDELIKAAIPTVMTIDGVTYDILGFLKGDEKSVHGTVMVGRAKEMNANLGRDDGQRLLDHQDEIPVALRGKVVFVFTDWRNPDNSEDVCCVFWSGDSRCWVRFWVWLGFDRDGSCRLLRRK